MKLGAIDIGSNAIRFQVTNVLRFKDSYTFKKVEYVRYPIRLGEDVFKIGRISKTKEEKFVKLFTAFSILIELYEVDHYLIYATSAMREASNGPEIAKRIHEDLGMQIRIIDGNKEAEVINKVVLSGLTDDNCLHIDVGGGSTEITVYSKKVQIRARSFQIGSVRKLDGKDSPAVWKAMEEWVKASVARLDGPVHAIGTGGNINKLHEVSGMRDGAPLSTKKLRKTKQMIEKMTFEERLNVLMMNPDRADVILPAAEIYLSVMEWAGANEILAPAVGLKDGMIQTLFEKHISHISVYKPGS